MIKKTCQVGFFLLFISEYSYANLTHISGSYFESNGEKVFYPCAGGGEPLVIYGSMFGSNNIINSKIKQEPIYLKSVFARLPLEVSNFAQTADFSDRFLIIQSQNPATDAQYVKLSLQKKDGTPFYINTVNFASAYVENGEKYVTNYKINLSNAVVMTQPTPIRLYSFQQDIGVNVFKNTNKAEAFQFTWNQNAAWSDTRNINNSKIRYNFKAQPTIDPSVFNGYGFWICGSENGK